MISSEIQVGRRVALLLEPGDDIFASIAAACELHDIRQAYVPVFIGVFDEVTLVGTCHPIEDHDAPLLDSVSLTKVEGVGSGTITTGPEGMELHLHVAVGIKALSSTGYAGHLLGGTIHYIAEVVIEEIASPTVTRQPNPKLFDIPTIVFG